MNEDLFKEKTMKEINKKGIFRLNQKKINYNKMWSVKDIILLTSKNQCINCGKVRELSLTGRTRIPLCEECRLIYLKEMA